MSENKVYKPGDMSKQITVGETIYTAKMLQDEVIVTEYKIESVSQTSFEAVSNGKRRTFNKADLGRVFFFSSGLCEYIGTLTQKLFDIPAQPLTALALKNFQKGKVPTEEERKQALWDSFDTPCPYGPVKRFVDWKKAEIESLVTVGKEVFMLKNKNIKKGKIIAVLKDDLAVKSLTGELVWLNKDAYLSEYFNSWELAKIALSNK